MLITIALVVLMASIACFFAPEFGRLFKKVFAIPGAKLLIPLFMASWLIVLYEEFGHWLLIHFQIMLHRWVSRLDALLPFETASISIARIISLFLIASMPIWIARGSAFRKKLLAPHRGTYWIGLMLWIIGAILLTLA